MKKKIIAISIIILLITLALCGCNEEEKPEQKTFEKVNFSSNVLELVDSALETQEDNDRIYNVEVTLYFKNLLSNIINVTYVVDFCDINDNVLYSKNYSLLYVPKNYEFITPDVFSYAGDNIDQFDHININIDDYEIIS